MVINATPASLAIRIALMSVSEVPSNIVTNKEGIMASAKPVNPSISAVTVSSDFIFLSNLRIGSFKMKGSLELYGPSLSVYLLLRFSDVFCNAVRITYFIFLFPSLILNPAISLR